MSDQPRRPDVYRAGSMRRPNQRFASSPSRAARIPHTPQMPYTPRMQPEPRSSWLREQYKELAAALRFLSIIPAPGSAQLFQTEEEDDRLVLGVTYFSCVGLLLGIILWLVAFLLGPYLPPLALAALLIVGLVVLTGGLHFDGLMDTFDGLLGGTDRERKLDIMRDSRVGSFGVLAGACVILLKFSFLASLPAYLMPLALLIVLPVSRWGMVLAVYLYPSARPDGLGAAFKSTVTMQRLVIVGGIALLVAFLFGHLVGVILWLSGGIFAFLLGWWMTRAIGGLTGDTYGALAELGDAFLLLLLLLLRSWL
jgi:cobalamin 5''-phosphate synthase/cobalamin synthase